MKNAIKKIILILLFLVTSSTLFSGCTFFRQSVSALRSTDHFIQHKTDPGVLYEPGAEDYANKIALFLPSAIQQVEEKQYHPFVKPVRVYICASKESFYRMYGVACKAGVLTKLFLSPRLFDEDDDIIKLYLIHELSHLHLLQQLGVYKMSRLPFWFKEGLATYVSGGGGAHTVTDKQAVDFIKSGNHFAPNETGGFIFQNTASDWGLEHHMFYRQSMLFINYLATMDETAFRKLLLSVENGERFPTALREAYNKNLDELWSMFLDEINNSS